MFEHSVKVPRHYKVAANIFKKVSTEGGSVKTLLYDDKLRHFRTNVLYALITETIKHSTDIDKLFENCKLVANEPRLDPWLAKVLTAELLFGKKALPGQSKPEQTILSYKEQFEKYANENKDVLKTEAVRRPRYVRINTNLLTTSDAIRAFQDEGYRFIRCTSGSYDDYLKQIQSLTEYDFTQDYHVKTVFVFSSGTKLHEHDLYLENKIILQDKATTMAVHLLAPPPGSVALDLCAAPGMKTTQLAAFMRNQGKIYAVERNEKRYQTLCDFVEKTGSKCVETVLKDALEIKRGDYDDVEYILLDPSCSGSGMELCVHNYIEDTRLAKLTSLQEKFLKHAMNSFPKAKRIVYSTCSIFPEENERVIANAVKTSRAKWRVQEVRELLKGQWNNFGSGMYGSMGARCMYARTDSDFTTGFFLAVLDRDQKDVERAQNIKHVSEQVNLKDTKRKDNGSEENVEKDNKAHRKRKDVTEIVVIEEISKEDQLGHEEVVNKKKKQNKHKRNDFEANENVNNTESISSNMKDIIDKEDVQTSEANENHKKKKKKNKHKEMENTGCGTTLIDSQKESLTITEDKSETRKNKKKLKKLFSNKVFDEIQSKEDILTIEDTDSTSKKKRKKVKDSIDSEGESILKFDVVEDLNDLSNTKKKKKRSKETTETLS